MSKKTKIINFVAGAGCGKSTMSAALYVELKTRHVCCELVQEYAKQLVWTEQFDELANQYHVSMTQYKWIKALEGKVDYLICDSPLLLGLFYNKHYPNNVSNIDKTEAMILEKMKEFDNIYIYLERGDYPYETHGRIHSEQESREIDLQLKQLMDKLNIPYKSFLSSRTSIPDMIQYVLQV